MDYRFTIQASNPRCLNEYDRDDANLVDAIQTVFPLDTECAILSWNWVYVPLSYKYDLAYMIDDALGLLDLMISNQIGRHKIHWTPNTFSCVWIVHWKDGTVTVDSEWTSVTGDTEAMLQRKPKIAMQCSEFIAEWKRPLSLIAAGLTSAGYGPKLAGLDRLKAVLDRMPRLGVLYQE